MCQFVPASVKAGALFALNSTSRFVHYIQDLPSLRERLFKKWTEKGGREEGRERDIQKRSSDGVWYSAKGLLRAGKVDGINHGVGACAMRVHLEKEELEGFGARG